jgi:hypothetical protein
LLVADSVIPDLTPDCKIVLSGSFEVLLSYSANQIQIPNVKPLMQRFGSDKHVPLKFFRLTVEFIGRISAELATSSRQVGQVRFVLSSNGQSILKPKTNKDWYCISLVLHSHLITYRGLRRLDSAIHRIVIFSTFEKILEKL